MAVVVKRVVGCRETAQRSETDRQNRNRWERVETDKKE